MDSETQLVGAMYPGPMPVTDIMTGRQLFSGNLVMANTTPTMPNAHYLGIVNIPEELYPPECGIMDVVPMPLFKYPAFKVLPPETIQPWDDVARMNVYMPS